MPGGAGKFVRRFSIRCQLALAAAAFATFSLASPQTASAQEALAASCTPTLNSYIGWPGDFLIAQVFTSQLTGSLSRAELEIRKDAELGDYEVQIRPAEPSLSQPGELEPGDAPLASTTVPDSSVPIGDSLLSVDLPPATLSAGQSYALAITRPDTSVANSLLVGGRAEDVCPHVYWYSNDGATWSPDLAQDVIFRVFVTPPTSPPAEATSETTCNGDRATIVGTAGADVLAGTPGRDVIAALEGGDRVTGLAAGDLICGGPGKDTLNGGKGKDRLLGQGGADRLKGGGGNDTCKGGKGRDVEKSC